MENKIRIALVDDHTLFRSGLKALLSRQADFEVVGEASDGLEGVKLVEQVKPDLVLLDLDMPVMNGREALAQIMETNPDVTVLMLTVSEDGEDLTECMRLGASGYLLKKIDADFLLQSIRRAVAGDNVISPEMTSALLMRLRTDKHTRCFQQGNCSRTRFGRIDREGSRAKRFAETEYPKPCSSGCFCCRAPLR